jgi:hypothetical protein
MTMTLQDVDTGEIRLVAVPVRPRHRDSFSLLFTDALQQFLAGQGRDLTRVELRVLLHVIATAGFGNTATTYASAIAEELGHDRSAVSRALATLEGLDVIRRAPHGRAGATDISLSPHLVYRGGVKGRTDMLKDRWQPLASPESAGPC